MVDDGRAETAYTISSPMSLKAQVSYKVFSHTNAYKILPSYVYSVMAKSIHTGYALLYTR